MRRFSPAFWIVIVLASAAAGAVYGLAIDEDASPVQGMIFGICIGTLATIYDRGLFLGRLRHALHRLPALAYFPAAEALLLGVVLIAMVVAGSFCWLVGLENETLLDSITPSGRSIAYSLLVCAAFIFVLRMRDLIGTEIFANLMLGRYHRPISEERAFLFLDLVGSTTYAERHGDLAAQELLKAVFAAVAEPIRRHRGQVDDYVGDEIIVSWPLARGVEEARCIACVFAIRAVLKKDAVRWLGRFGIVPELRAALHGGSIVTAEVGVDRHKIAYFGDVMNATARLEGLCRETGRAVLISEALLARMPALPQGIAAEALGGQAMRGRSGTMAVHALADTRQAERFADARAGGVPDAQPLRFGLDRPVLQDAP